MLTEVQESQVYSGPWIKQLGACPAKITTRRPYSTSTSLSCIAFKLLTFSSLFSAGHPDSEQRELLTENKFSKKDHKQRLCWYHSALVFCYFT